MKQCLVIMPFEKELDPVYDKIFRAIISVEPDINISRADDYSKNGKIIQDVVQKIHNSDIVIADLTNLNENVFYVRLICRKIKKLFCTRTNL